MITSRSSLFDPISPGTGLSVCVDTWTPRDEEFTEEGLRTPR